MSREIHIHVEEPSMEAYLLALLPRLELNGIVTRIINHTNKQKLLRQLPLRLRGYARFSPKYRPLTIVLIDRDRHDCKVLKRTLESAASNAGLVSKSKSTNSNFEVVNRIVVEELEAWHFGDVNALRAEFPRISASLGSQIPFRIPDAITGGTHEALLRVLQKAGYYRELKSLPKIDTARRIAQKVDFVSNRSGSFQQALTAQFDQG